MVEDRRREQEQQLAALAAELALVREESTHVNAGSTQGRRSRQAVDDRQSMVAAYSAPPIARPSALRSRPTKRAARRPREHGVKDLAEARRANGEQGIHLPEIASARPTDS